jgi:hypothetical protein
MMYCPHILQKLSKPESQVDDNGNPIVGSDIVWIDVCKCRCDDNTTKEFKNTNGDVYRPSYHIVYENAELVKADTEIRCLNADGSVRGFGKVYLPKMTNYFNYRELWV